MSTPKTLYPEQVVDLLEIISAAADLLTLRQMETRRSAVDPVTLAEIETAHANLRHAIEQAWPTIEKLIDTNQTTHTTPTP
jgi:hypothetical protein